MSKATNPAAGENDVKLPKKTSQVKKISLLTRLKKKLPWSKKSKEMEIYPLF